MGGVPVRAPTGGRLATPARGTGGPPTRRPPAAPGRAGIQGRAPRSGAWSRRPGDGVAWRGALPPGAVWLRAARPWAARGWAGPGQAAAGAAAGRAAR